MDRDFCIIVACTKTGIIGNLNKIPWYLPEDLKRFKHVTMGSDLIMGRSTHESIGRVLPGRKNIVITRNKEYEPLEGAYKATSLVSAVKLSSTQKVFICGGEQIYKQFLDQNLCDRIYLTLIKDQYSGDRIFPIDSINEENGWKLLSDEDYEKHSYRVYDKFLRHMQTDNETLS